ncbi:hypothetical protein D3C87_175540 [compost metagenome]
MEKRVCLYSEKLREYLCDGRSLPRVPKVRFGFKLVFMRPLQGLYDSVQEIMIRKWEDGRVKIRYFSMVGMQIYMAM